MSLVLGVICATFLCYIGYYWYKHVQIGQKLSWLPTVRGWPIVGNGLEFTNTETLLADITRLIPKKEKMVYLTHLGISNIFTTDYDLIELVLSSQSILKKSSDYRYAKNWLGTGLLTSDGGKWKSRRRITTPAFHFSILEQFVEVFESNGNIFIEKLKKVVDKESIDVYPFITLYALDVICETAMGVSVNAQKDANSAYVQNVKLMCKISLVRTISVIKRFDITYPLTLDYYREKRALKQLHGVTNSVIDARRSTINDDIKTEVDELGRKKRLAFLDILLRSTTTDGQPLTREDIREEVDTFMFEGHDTTASAMTFCVHFLSENPEVQKRILEEQKEIFGDDKFRPSTIKDLHEMKYLECVIKETLRLCPSVPMYGRHVQEDFYFKGNLIPKGVNIVVFDYGVLRDPDYYPNPEKFDPSRFEQVDGKRPYQYIPFSAGPRNCIGWIGCLTNYMDTYGSTIIVHDGPLSIGLVTREAKLFEHILSSYAFINKDGPYTYLQSWLGTGLLTSVGTKWKKRRRMLTPSFHFSILDNFVEIFDNVSNIFIKKLEREIGKDSVDISPLVSLMTLDIICEAAMGIKINAQSEKNSEYVQKVKVMCSILTERMISPIHPILYPFTINYFREKRALKVLHAHTDKIIETRMNEQTDKSEDDYTDNVGKKQRLAFLDLLLKSTIDGEPLSRLDIREEVDTFMFEGHDTTSSAISFTMYALSTHPEIQEKLFLEQTNIFEDLRNAKPSIPQLQEMKYLELVIKEALRLYPSVPFNGRTLTEDLELDGVLYPKGLNIMLFTFAMHRNPEYFPDPLEFKPERFQDSSRVNPYVYVPFSAGPRNCIGQKFAMLELKSTLSKVIRTFELLPASPVQDLQLAPETILVSKNGIHISLKKRIIV